MLKKYMIILILLFSSCATTAPLPSSINMIKPASYVPSELANFSGIWSGKWNGLLDVILVVKYIDVRSAEVIFSLGKWGNDYGIVPQNNFRYITATVNRKIPSLEWVEKNQNKFKFEINDKGNRLTGSFIYYNKRPSGETLRADLRKINAEEIPDIKFKYRTFQ